MNSQQPTNAEGGITNDETLMINTTFKPGDPVKNTYVANTIASQGPFMSSNGLGAGRSLSQKTWTLINKNIKGIEEQNPLVPLVSSKQLIVTAGTTNS